VNVFIETVTSDDPRVRHRSLDALSAATGPQALLDACEGIEAFRRSSDNLYEKVRASLFLYAAYRYHLLGRDVVRPTGTLPPDGFADLLERRFEQAIRAFRRAMAKDGPNEALLSALAEAYRHLAFQYLSDQVRSSVRASVGNRWMFRVGHPEDHPLRIRKAMLQRSGGSELFPILVETTPVRLDLSHSGWSDIFFLGMDYPEGARVLNISVDLGVYGRDAEPRPPIETYVRVIGEPILRLTSVDLEATKDIVELRDLFNFGNDYLGLLKAGVIASGAVPPSLEGTGLGVAPVLARLIGPGMGLELVTKVNDIPQGSRLAVSTNLLASIVTALMRATGQTERLEGPLREDERRLVASRAILGEWLGGSGGGWQDSGGVWPGIKVIEGVEASEGDPEHGISRGRLLPRHRILGEDALHPEIRERLTSSLVVIHGGMAQNVGPILEMVTEKYLLRAEAEWRARLAMHGIFDAILEALKRGDVRALAAQTTRNWEGPLKTIIPWVTNRFTESIIARARAAMGDDFWGFLMLGGMSGGGMATFAAPDRQAEFRDRILDIMVQTKRELEDALPFAMDPLVYDFRINDSGTTARLVPSEEAIMPSRYYALQVPELVRQPADRIPYQRRIELDSFAGSALQPEETRRLLRTLVGHLFRVSAPASHADRAAWDEEAERIKVEHGFDAPHHEQMREDLRTGRIGLAHNRLAPDTDIQDAEDGDVVAVNGDPACQALGARHLREGRVAVLTLAAGVGSRWTTGAGVIKAVNPFVIMDGRHRSFLEIHLAKTRRSSEAFGLRAPHVVSTSLLTHGAIERHLRMSGNYGFDGPLYLSPGRSIGQRLIPTVRDLLFLWQEMPQEMLDEQKQKVRDAVREALMAWAREKGEASDYTDNVPIQRFNPPGHWYEVPNLLRNGVLARLLAEHPQVETLMLHNVDTLGVSLDPDVLGAHLKSEAVLSFEVVPRRIEDRGGGLARVNGRLRLLEGLAQPREEDELRLRYYNSMTTWIQVDPLLEAFGLTRGDLETPARVTEAVRRMAQRMPTYVTIKDVKRRWGQGREDIFPVAQFEKLWSDMTTLPNLRCAYLAVPRARGQQLKDPAQLDAWARDGSRDYVARLAGFAEGDVRPAETSAETLNPATQ
jgi:hypothetical protein